VEGLTTRPSEGEPASAAEVDAVSERLAELRGRIQRAGVDPSSVRIVAVTKGFSAISVRAAAAAGLQDLGENYASELLAKADEARELGVRWHFLGAVQRNKVKRLAPYVALWQSVARLAEGREIARWAPGARLLVQVDVVGRSGRNGCRPVEVPELAEGLVDLGLRVEGLMAVGPGGAGAEARAAFRQVGALRHSLGLAELSIGMTDDLEVALGEGSTMVRVGRGLFGPRSSPTQLRQ
jgi:uncharacterized pyridoxal phosphate-containing UPF0001 family protein